MTIAISTHFAFQLDQPTDALLQFEVAALPEQSVLEAKTNVSATEHFARVGAHDDIGERIWLRAEGLIEVEYQATIEPRRIVTDISSLSRIAPHRMPGEAVQYLFDSRYCQADMFQNFVHEEFAGTEGGARIEAISQWLATKFSYVPGSSNASTDAAESFVSRQGICRDYAHVLVTLARASTIPARYVACYAPGVTPQDFHAVAEVFLENPQNEDGGAWHLIDATGMADPTQTAKIGVGRDAADVSFLTSFGPNTFLSCSVDVRPV
ncbi:transglutaminase family protein [uncultured Erythrobacter sp.]|uniref:transglutaminase-like domain-containing protein n=1 Tax=uncultured Erythrobacter sp. TaxID=263913 RepID=UPI0026050B65|nr:transglutaminase family protein [uncultured Erythrobacter sp.]